MILPPFEERTFPLLPSKLKENPGTGFNLFSLNNFNGTI
jgi:hypothetical protein